MHCKFVRESTNRLPLLGAITSASRWRRKSQRRDRYRLQRGLLHEHHEHPSSIHLHENHRAATTSRPIADHGRVTAKEGKKNHSGSGRPLRDSPRRELELPCTTRNLAAARANVHHHRQIQIRVRHNQSVRAHSATVN